MALSDVGAIAQAIAWVSKLWAKWFGYYEDPVAIKARQDKMTQQEMDDFNNLLAKAKAGDRKAQDEVRKILSTPI